MSGNTNGLDQFYTNKDIAISCFKTLSQQVDLDDYDHILEPSAGNGSFYLLLDCI